MNLWTELARRLHMSREYTKRVALLIFYGGAVDPWLDHLVKAETDQVMKEIRAARRGM
jgi:hypothetical protein